MYYKDYDHAAAAEQLESAADYLEPRELGHGSEGWHSAEAPCLEGTVFQACGMVRTILGESVVAIEARDLPGFHALHAATWPLEPYQMNDHGPTGFWNEAPLTKQEALDLLRSTAKHERSLAEASE